MSEVTLDPEMQTLLQDVGKQMHRAGIEVRRTNKAFDDAVAEAFLGGVPIRRIAITTGVDRKTIYRSLARTGHYEPPVKEGMTDEL